MTKHFDSALIVLLTLLSTGQALAQTEPNPAPAPSDQPTTEPASEPAPAATAPEPAQPKRSYAAMAAATPGYTEAQSGPGGLDLRLQEHALIPIVRAGFVSAGSGTYKIECDGVGCSSVQSTEVDYDEKSGFIIGGDLLFRVVPKLRLGFGLNYLPTPKVEAQDGGNEFESGDELDVLAVVEGVFPVSESVGLFVRGMGGITMLFPGNDHQDQIDSAKAACEGTGAECKNSDGPFVGPTFGLGFGVLFLVGSVGLRAEVWGQSISQPIFKETVGVGGLESDIKGKFTGSRGIFFVGAEF